MENVTADAPRIPPLEPPFAAEAAAQLERMMPAGQPPIALFRTFAKHPRMVAAMGSWGRYELSRELSLTMRQREIVIDRVCARCGCEYEWGVHILVFAERVGLTPEQVRSLTSGTADDPCWDDPVDRLLVRAVDQLHDTSDVDDELWSALASALDESQLLDLLLLAGWYHAISYCARASRTPLEPGAPTFASVAG